MTRNGHPEHIRAGCEASLQRLGTDHIDLYQLHRVDPEVPLEESWGAMAELVVAGKVGAIGLSEVSVAELDRAAAIHAVASVQSELSLWTRDTLPEVLPWCAEHGAGFLPFSPLGRGFLTGALAPGFESTDFRTGLPRFTEEAMARTRRSSTAYATWPSGTEPPWPRSRSRGCSLKATASCRSPGPAGAPASRRTQPQQRSS